MPQPSSSGGRWFPTIAQLQDPTKTEVAFRQVLTQLYALQDRLAAIEGKGVSAPKGPPPGSGPADSMLLGLFVAPVDTRSLADGTKLTYVKAAGNLQFL